MRSFWKQFIVLVTVMPATALAFQPLITDDTGT